MRKYTVVIQAGGMGTRMRELTEDKIPKPMLKLNGKPLIEWQMDNMAEYGFRDFVIIVGHLGEKICEYYGDGSNLSYNIRYIMEDTPLGSAGSLYNLNEMGIDNDIILLYGDVMFCIEWDRALRFHKSHGGKVTLFVHPNTHPHDSDLVEINDDGLVTGILYKNEDRKPWQNNCVNAGLYVIDKTIIKDMPEAKKNDLERDIITPIINSNKVYAYKTPEYIKDVGTPDRFFLAEREQRSGLWDRKCLRNKQSCVFLDRDGTLNIYKGLIDDIDKLELEKGAACAIRKLNDAGILAIVVTNQPVVARGMCDIGDVQEIHKKLQTLLGKEGAYLDDIVFCPHHPDKGYPEENKAYKMRCNCRKPNTGMIDRMVDKYNIDISKSFIIGDSTVDIMTGINAGLETILLETGQKGQDGKYEVEADKYYNNILDAVVYIISNKKG